MYKIDTNYGAQEEGREGGGGRENERGGGRERERGGASERVICWGHRLSQSSINKRAFNSAHSPSGRCVCA